MLFEPRRQRQGPGKGKEGAVIAVVGLMVVGLFCWLFSNVSNPNTPFFDRSGLMTYIIVFGLIAAGIIGLRLFLWANKSDPETELARPHLTEQEQERRRVSIAQREAAQAPNVAIQGQQTSIILGAHIKGDLSWNYRTASGHWAVLPEPELAKHGVIIGSSGSGKTVSALRIGYIAALKLGYRVFYLDAKGDRDTAAAFIALMRQAGQQPRMFPRETFAGWRGDGNALFNRLLAIETFSDDYYKAVSKRVLTLICNDPAGPPRSAAQFFSRFTDTLKDRAKLQPRELAGVELRYRAFFEALAGKLDGAWSWEDAESGYILIDGLALKDEAASLGRFMLDDFAHYASARKTPGTKDLLIVDEYSALATRGTDAANLVERLRSYGCAVILCSQSYAGLGDDQDAERILDASNWLMLHRTAAPEPLARRAGIKKRVQSSYGFGGSIQDFETRGTMRVEEEENLHPDEVRRLQVGEAAIVAQGHYIRYQAARPATPPAGEVDQARQWIAQAPAAAPQIQPAPAPAPAPTIQPGQAPAPGPATPPIQPAPQQPRRPIARPPDMP